MRMIKTSITGMAVLVTIEWCPRAIKQTHSRFLIEKDNMEQEFYGTPPWAGRRGRGGPHRIAF